MIYIHDKYNEWMLTHKAVALTNKDTLWSPQGVNNLI